MVYLLYLVIFISLVFAFVNGFHDGCNVFATAVASRSIKPQKALLLAGISEFIIPVLTGTAVASTISRVLEQDMILKARAGYSVLVILAALLGAINTFYVPLWVKICSSGALASGLLFGGWRILHTVGNKIYKQEPMHSINAQVASASVIYISSILGGAVSTSQIISSAITGVGAGERYNAVNWKVVENIISSWLLTIPSAAAVSMLIFFIIKQVAVLL